jgi:hypothetical protein
LIKRNHGKYRSALAKTKTIQDILPFVKEWLSVWDKWTSFKKVLLVRYEDLITDTRTELNRLADHLSIDLNSIDLHKITSRYSTENLPNYDFKFLHFNKGVSGRFRDEMSRKEIDLCNTYLGNYLEKMGYTT